MSARVDVLATIERAEGAVNPQRASLRDDLRAARAAVAELIDAARFAQETLAKIHGTDARHASRQLLAALEAIA